MSAYVYVSPYLSHVYAHMHEHVPTHAGTVIDQDQNMLYKYAGVHVSHGSWDTIRLLRKSKVKIKTMTKSATAQQILICAQSVSAFHSGQGATKV